MRRNRVHAVTLATSLLGIACWVVMFLAGTDVWHVAGRPDFWNLQGPPYEDLRAFAYAFYVLPLVLLAHVVSAVLGLRDRRSMLTS